MASKTNICFSQFKNTENFVGVYECRTPKLMILNPEYARKVYVNDFKSFHDNEFGDFVSDMLLF